MTENEDLLAKIGQLAGQINRHKSSETHPTNSHSQYVSRHAPTHQGWAPYYRGRGRGRGRGTGAPHRHRTLVLNNTGSGSTTGASPSTTPTNDFQGPTPTSATSTGNGWIAKRDRHMQLINSTVYEKETQARSRAMEETRKFREQQKAERQQAKVLRYAQGPGGVAAVSTAAHSTGGHEIMVNDVAFRVGRGGSKLTRILNDPSTANNTPKRVTVAGVPFVRSKNGNLHRLGAVTSKKPNTVKKRDELCKRFSTTGTCYKGPTCLFTHDPSKVAICKDFLQTGQCAAGSSCDLSHEPSPHRSPTCMHFLRGRCANPECRYAHIRVTPGAPVCRAFATLGYCDKGDSCEEKHVHECPDYANAGACNKKRCQLPHVDRADQIRKAAAAAAAADQGDDESDASSEEEAYDAIDSDDVDSDEFDDSEEILEGVDSGEMSQQKDFIAF
ncbi:unnamed protein product [Penicillium salamii]|uniref:C3H1-type domain-containing protein n=1 Tax=Penicillium salamii TaxID=1612424 RepID=A0A9W4NA91_9EURO|nr:unnamed protein product [Penicillium salamii]CAG8049377.1 unnamed protein product [Penicillium salamii]CAG8333246.1 unnamed protein product [Penicillium salamii]CAG8333431.1 unnamed protein product [Penicillium salamii]CAG8341935.1 unnamed protein product [Penicillium salamii]